jgi:hypothetical protein
MGKRQGSGSECRVENIPRYSFGKDSLLQKEIQKK